MKVNRLNLGGKTIHIFQVDRQEVERKDTSRLVKTLKMLDDAGIACNTVWFAFDGYDADRREIFEIEEIRQWVKIAFHKIPHLIYYAERDQQEGLQNLLSLYLDMSMFYHGERVNAYEAVERGLDKEKGIKMQLTLPNDVWMKMKQKVRKHAIKFDNLEEAEKTIKKVESIFD